MTEPIKLTKGPLAGKEVHVAPQDRVTRLEPFVGRVLEALDHPEALVTDMSSLMDFSPNYAAGPEHPENALWIAELGAKLGVPLSYDDLIADVAERLQGGH